MTKRQGLRLSQLATLFWAEEIFLPTVSARPPLLHQAPGPLGQTPLMCLPAPLAPLASSKDGSWHSARVSSAYFWMCVWKELWARVGVRVCRSYFWACVPQKFLSSSHVRTPSLLPSPSQSDTGCSVFIFPLSFHGNPHLRVWNPHVLSQSSFSLPQTLCFRLLDWAYMPFSPLL